MSKILDGKIHALNSQWAYIGIEYTYECDYSLVFEDIYKLMRGYIHYVKDQHHVFKMEEFSIIKYPAFELDGEKHKAFLIIKFKRIPEDGLDE